MRLYPNRRLDVNRDRSPILDRATKGNGFLLNTGNLLDVKG
jgi:hypothetical protein